MPKDSDGPEALPEHTTLRQLKEQAKDLLKARAAKTLAAAHFQMARLYGFGGWAQLKARVEYLVRVRQLKEAIDRNDLERVKQLMIQDPELHRAPLGYGKDGPLTWVSECRVPWEAPGVARLAMARWMIENGSDIHQGGDEPLMRAALNGDRVSMMELLVSLGADVNAWWHGWFPIIFAACEAVNPVSLKWLLAHGADPNCGAAKAGVAHPGTALDYLIGAYSRHQENLSECMGALLDAGGVTRFNAPPVLALLRGRLEELAGYLEADAGLAARRFPELEFGTSGGRFLTLRGTTLLHVAAEYGNEDAIQLLLSKGADVNARAEVDTEGVGGQTAIFHAATQFEDGGLGAVRRLIEAGADLRVVAKLPGHYERPGELVEGTVLEYARRFPGGEGKTVAALRAVRSAP